MTLHLLTSGSEQPSHPESVVALLQQAAQTLGIDCVVHDLSTKPLEQLPKLGEGDLYYRIATGKHAKLAEQIMVGPACATFYQDWKSVTGITGCSYFTHQYLPIPTIPTVPFIPTTEEGLVQAVEKLGGFPIIVKIRGGSHGVGVIRVDSLPSFKSLTDYLRTQETPILLRKYIEHDYYARAVVVGNRLVAGHVAFAQGDEFRTNSGDDTEQRREVFTPTPELEKQIIQAVQSLGLETGGVDILFDKEGEPFIAEVNFPNNFSITQRVTGKNIAEAMVQHLIDKKK